MKKEYIRISLDQIIPYENNPRKNDGAVPYVQESIKQVGYISPIIIDENNVILAGHTRAKALKESKADEVEVIKVYGLTDEQKRKYRLLDNKTNEFAEWDFDTLEEELNGLDFGDFDFGFAEMTGDQEFEFDQEKTDIKYFKDSEIENAIIEDWKNYESVNEFADQAIDKASAMYQFNRLCQGYNEGYNISALFNPHRFDTETRKSKSILYGWNNDPNYRKQFARYAVEVNNRVPPKNEFYKLIGIGTGGYQFVNEFQPCIARDIYKKYVKNGDKVLNPCAGWGGKIDWYCKLSF